MRGTGFEPAQALSYWILSPARLTTPAPSQHQTPFDGADGITKNLQYKNLFKSRKTACLMKLEELARTSEIKVIDSSVLNPSSSIIGTIYDCSSAAQLGVFPLEEWTCDMVEYKRILHLGDFYSIKEASDEFGVFLEKLNEKIRFLSKPESYFFWGISKSSQIIRRLTRRKKALKKSLQEDTINYGESEDNKNSLEPLKQFAKEVSRLSRKLKGQDITRKFSEFEARVYSNLTNYFTYVSEMYRLKVDASLRHEKLKSRNPCEFSTDEKLVATSLVLALSQPVSLVTRDNDLKKMLRFFYLREISQAGHKLDQETFDLLKKEFGVDGVNSSYPVSLYLDPYKTGDFQLEKMN